MARSAVLRSELQKLYSLMELFVITLQPVHVQGILNVVANELSRRLDQEDYCFSPTRFAEFQLQLGSCVVDRFDLTTNRMLPRFWSWDRCPGCQGVDAFSAPLSHWRQGRLWCNPPRPSVLPKLVRLLRHSGAAATVLAPHWRSASWMAGVLELADTWKVLPPIWDLFCPGFLGSQVPIGPLRWSVGVVSAPVRSGWTCL